MFDNRFRPWTLILSASISLIHVLVKKQLFCQKDVIKKSGNFCASSEAGMKLRFRCQEMLEIADINAWIVSI